MHGERRHPSAASARERCGNENNNNTKKRSIDFSFQSRRVNQRRFGFRGGVFEGNVFTVAHTSKRTTALHTRTPSPPFLPSMRAFRVAAALCVAAFLVAGAEAGASLPRVSPSTDASLLREKLLASKLTKATNDVTNDAKDLARALRAKGQDGLFDGVFADAREHLPTRNPDASGLDNARLSAAQRKLLWGGWRTGDAETDDATPEPAPAPVETPVTAMGSTPTETPAPAPAPVEEAAVEEEEPTPRGFLANALLLNRLRAVVAGDAGAAQSLVASAALTSALRNLDPATTLFGQIIGDVRARREAAQNPVDTAAAPAPATTDASAATSFPVGGDAADAILAAFRDAADDRARELLAEAFLARFGATNVTVSSSDDDDGTEGTLLERLDLATLDGMSSAEVERLFAAALDAGFEGLSMADILNGASGASGDNTGEDTTAARLAAEAYRALFAASLDAAGSFVKEKFDSDGDQIVDENARDGNMTGADLDALLAATVEAAEANAASFVTLGFNDGDGDDLSPEAAVALLDRVHAVLAAARGDFTTALENARDANGEPIAWPGVDDDAMPSGTNGFLSAAEIVALIGGVSFAPNASLRDIGVAFTVTDDSARLQQDFEIFDDALVAGQSDDQVVALAGPDVDDQVVDLAGPDVDDTSNTAAGTPTPSSSNKKKPVHETVGFQVGLPVAIVAVAALAIAARASGAADRAFGSVLPSRAATADQAMGMSTAVASGSGSVVRRSSTSTKIEM